jgi:hypothetical protein
MYSSREYYQSVLGRDENARDFFRYYEVVGAEHCNGPTGVAFPLNALEDLRSWVEDGDGAAPEVLRGVKLGSEEGEVDEVRVICAWPRVPKYDNGSGSCVELGSDARRGLRDEL